MNKIIEYPLVSIIVNCYNGERFLKIALESLSIQTYVNFEVLFVDNCSQDRSASIYKDFSLRDDRFRYLLLRNNLCLGAARKIAVEQTSGDFIAFLDVDDIWHKDKLQIQIDSLIRTQSNLAYANVEIINEFGCKIGRSKGRRVKDDLKSNLLRYRINLATLIIQRDVLVRNSLNFDENIEASEEYCLVMQLLARGAKVNFIDTPLSSYRVLDNSLTVKKIDSWCIDRRYTLSKIEKELPTLRLKYGYYLDYSWSVSDYYEVLYFLSIGEDQNARNVISNNSSNFMFILFIKCMLHPILINFYKKLLNWKYGRRLF